MRIAFLAWSVALAGCAGAAASGESPKIDRSTLVSQLEVVRSHRILFSHHSVGRDLIAGLERASRELGQPLKVVTLEQASSEPTQPSFVSVSGGRNQEPYSKLAFFAETLRAAAYEPDLAFLKFCYVDFNPHTDVDALFAEYQRTIDALKRAHPRVQLAHITAPLMQRPMQLKDRINRLLGREVWEDAANVKRALFNQKLRDVYGGDPIFDLARVESTQPDGSRASFQQDGRTYYALARAYTDDGGHLNKLGQDHAALAWIQFLSGALARSPH